jgi:hypothetical protein
MIAQAHELPSQQASAAPEGTSDQPAACLRWQKYIAQGQTHTLPAHAAPLGSSLAPQAASSPSSPAPSLPVSSHAEAPAPSSDAAGRPAQRPSTLARSPSNTDKGYSMSATEDASAGGHSLHPASSAAHNGSAPSSPAQQDGALQPAQSAAASRRAPVPGSAVSAPPPSVCGTAAAGKSACADAAADAQAPAPVRAQAPASVPDLVALPDAASLGTPKAPDVSSALTIPELPAELPCRLRNATRECLGRQLGDPAVRKVFQLVCSSVLGSIATMLPLSVCIFSADAERPVDEKCGIDGVQCTVASHFPDSGHVTCEATSELDAAGASLLFVAFSNTQHCPSGRTSPI